MKRQDKARKETGSKVKSMRKAAAVLLLGSIFCLGMGGMAEAAAAGNEVDAESAAKAGIIENAAMESEATDVGTIGMSAMESEAAEAVTIGNIAIEASASAAGAAEREAYFDGWVQDDAGLLTLQEEEELEAECGRLFQAHGAGVYIVTTPDFGGGDIKDWQRRIFSQYDLGADSGGSGVMLAISMAERDWGLVGFGAAQEAFSTYARERLGSMILDDLSDGEFYKAFSGYLSMADDCFAAAEKGKPYTEQHRYREGWRFPVIIGAAFLLSLGVSAGVVMSWKKGMNTRVRQKGAMEYLKAGSFYLSNQSDLFLYHTVSRTQRPKQDTSSSGGGSMHSDSSGTSGKF